MKVLATPRLLLREFTTQDAPFFLELVNDPTWIQHIGQRNVHTLEDAEAYLSNKMIHSYREHGFGLYLVEEKEEKVSMGICGFVKRDFLKQPDIGFAFLPRFTGQGFALESASAIMEYGKNILGFDNVLAITSKTNERSISLLMKLGFAYDKVYVYPDGEEVKLFSFTGE